MKRYEERAIGYRLQAAAARARGLASDLPKVRETLEHAAATWDALARVEDILLAGALRRAARVLAARG